ncbi:hypothetical protein BOG92_037280 [Streptomyces sp. WAC00263]|nr:hypothetical protein BOG92_037280 [Streptomyces sp. WAC00263]
MIVLLVGRGDLTNDEWTRLAPHLPESGRRGGRWSDHRMVINGILFRVSLLLGHEQHQPGYSSCSAPFTTLVGGLAAETCPQLPEIRLAYCP